MQYSVVITSYNKKRHLDKAIKSVLRQKEKPSEFIIVDNGSTDGSIELLLDYKRKYPNFRIFKSKINVGYCKGINIGVNLAQSSFILVMDHDAILTEQRWAELALKNLREGFGLVWGNPGILDSVNYGEFFLGSAFLTKKEIFQEVGMFDEKFFVDENEADLSVRLYRAGYRIFPLRKGRIFHLYRPKDQRYYIFGLSNRILIYWKYFPYWISLIMTFLHCLQEFKEIKDFRLLKYYRLGIKRLISNLYRIGLSYPNHMGLKEFFKSAYQLRFPAFGYRLIKFLYSL